MRSMIKNSSPCAVIFMTSQVASRRKSSASWTAEYTATLGSRSEEIAACKAKTRPACATQLLVDCVESRQGSICASVTREACRAYVDCELGT